MPRFKARHLCFLSARRQRSRRCLPLLLSAVLVLYACTGCGTDRTAAAQGSSGIVKSSDEQSETSFELTMLDVGQGLAILIEADGQYLIYDGGGGESSSYVVSCLKQSGVTDLDYLIASHYDEDHVSGLVGILNTMTVGTAVTPDYEADSKIYSSFRKALADNGADEIHPFAGDTCTLGGADVLVLSPADYSGENENDHSIALRVDYGEFSCIITGDAGYDAEQSMLSSGFSLDADVYVVGHHGSATSSSEDFVKAVSPAFALISVGADNEYGHPAEKTLETLTENQAEIFRTDQDGEIHVYSDGETFWVECGEKTTGEEEETSVRTFSYVLNYNTMKFHLPDCASVDQMSESNKGYSSKTRDELIADGYSPCKNCNP